MIGAEQIAAEFIAQIDEQLEKVFVEMDGISARLGELKTMADGLRIVRARLLGEAPLLTGGPVFGVERSQITHVETSGPVAAPKPAQVADERPRAAAHPFPIPDPDQPARSGKPHRDAWSVGEESILREFYPAEGVVGCMARLPGRKDRAIMIRASRLGLQTESKRPSVRKNGWRDEENAVISQFYPAGGPQACAKKLDGRSVDCIRQQARKLGVKLDPAVLAARRAEGGRVAGQAAKARAAAQVRKPEAVAPKPVAARAPKPEPFAPKPTVVLVPKMTRPPELPDAPITDIDEAKRILARRHAPVCSMAVHGGSSIQFQVGQAKNVPLNDLLAMAERERQRERERAAA